jgi:hypothetical protein
MAVLRRDGTAVLPPMPSKEVSSSELPRIIVLDRCNLDRTDRKQFLEAGNLAKSEVIAVHFDAPEGHSAHFELPSEREGFRAVVRLKGTAAAMQDLARKWTEERVEEPPHASQDLHQFGEDLDEENDAPPPALPLLKQWIEVEERGGHRGMRHTSGLWGMQQMEEPIDFPLDLLPGGFDEHFAQLGASEGVVGHASSSSAPVGGGWGNDMLEEATQSSHYQPLLATSQTACFGRDQPSWAAEGGAMPVRHPPLQAWEADTGSNPWPVSMELGGHRHQQQHSVSRVGEVTEEDEEDDQQEQLAAMLRGMGFDEEPSLLAAQRAGGNLNVAVETVLRGNGASIPT